MRSALILLLCGLFIAYPILIYFGLQRVEPRVIAIVFLAVVGARIAVIDRKLSRSKQQLFPWLFVLGIGILPVLYSNSEKFLLVIPCIISTFFFCFFGLTLLRPPTVVERLARLKFPDLPLEAIVYCRNVTIVWCTFFLLNGCISLWTVFQEELAYWTIYNGFISYIAIGLLFTIEFCYRRIIKEPQFIRSVRNRSCKT